jgi:hypothetical protein
MKRMRRFLLGAVLAFSLPLAVSAQDSAQDFAKAELSAGYSLYRLSTSNPGGDLRTTTHGWDISIAPNINRNLAIVFDFGGHYGSFNEASDFFGIPFSQKVDVQVHTVMAGPRVSETVNERWRPFAQALFGYHRSNLDFSTEFPTQPTPSIVDADTRSGFAMAIGGGLDLLMGPFFGVRLFQAEYVAQRWRDVDARVEGARIGAGIIFRFGSRSY